MTKRKSCPECRGFNMKDWALGKLKCSDCNLVFSRLQVQTADYIPVNPRANKRRISDHHERLTAKAVGGKRTPASGAMPINKADVVAEGLRVECKSTYKQSFLLKKEYLGTVAKHAQDDEIPVLAVEFRAEPGMVTEDYYVISKDWFLQLLEAYRRD